MAIKDAEARYQEKQKRRRGLQKTRFYCQVCQRQCLDENGFKCHVKSEIHMRNVRKQLTENKGSVTEIIQKYSQEFHESFIRSLRIHHGEKLIGLNKFYQEFISEKEHVHLNATRWKSLTSYARYLRETAENARVVALNEDEDISEGGEKFLVAYVAPRSAQKQDPELEECADEVLEGVSVGALGAPIGVDSAGVATGNAIADAVAAGAALSLPSGSGNETATESSEPERKQKPKPPRGKLKFALKRG